MVNDPSLVEKTKGGGQREVQKVYINLSYQRCNVSKAREKQGTCAGLDCPQLWLCSYNSAKKLE